MICSPTGHRYIGATTNLRIRRNTHFSSLRNGNHLNRRLQALYDKHGAAAFQWQVIAEKAIDNETEEWLRIEEQRVIQSIARTDRDLLLSAPSAPYHTASRKGATPAKKLKAFQEFCRARDLIPGDVLIELLEDFMGKPAEKSE